MLNFYYGFMHWLPVILAVIGLIMRVIPRGGYGFKKGLNFRQTFGIVLLYPFAALSLIQFGADRKDLFYEGPGGHTVYACLSLRDTTGTAADTAAVQPIATDTVAVQVTVSDSTIYTKQASDRFTIPFEEENGVKYITLKVGTANIRAMYDTGCSYDIAFCPKDYFKLVGAGVIEEGKYIGTSRSQIVDGRTVDNGLFVLPSCVVGNLKFNEKTVVAMQTGDVTLVGNSLFKNFSSVAVDTQNACLVLTR